MFCILYFPVLRFSIDITFLSEIYQCNLQCQSHPFDRTINMFSYSCLSLFLLLLFLTVPFSTAEWVKRYREFDFNSSRTSYDSLRIAPEKNKFIVKDISHADDITHQTTRGKKIVHNNDQYVAVAGDQLLAVNGELVTTMSLREILRQPFGRFMLPLVSRPEDDEGMKETANGGNNGYQIMKWLRLEILEAETISFRPQLAARQAKMRRANFELNEQKEMKRNAEEGTKIATRRRALDLEEGEKSVERRKREEQETKHQQKMLQAKEEMDIKQKILENAEKSRAEGGFKREQARKQNQQKSISENQKKATELSKAAAQATAHVAHAKRNIAQEDMKKLQDQSTKVMKERQSAEIGKVRERVAKENEEHRKSSEEIEKERNHQKNLAKADEEARKKLVESIRSEQEAKRVAVDAEHSRKAEEEHKSAVDPMEYVDVKFRHKGPLGLFFVPGQMPMTIAKNGKDDPPFKLQEGDQLIQINDEEVVDLETPDEIIEVLTEASWPKTLKFRRLKKVGQVDEAHPGAKGSAVSMTIVKPNILSGWDMQFELAHFGEQIAKFCTAKPVVPAQPEDACKPLQGQGDFYVGKLVLVIRGGCMFSVKANNLAKKGALGMVVVNTDDKLLRMPTSPKDPVSLTGPSMLIKKSDGILVQSVLKVIHGTEQKLMTRLAGGGTGCNMLVGNEQYRRKHSGKEDGILHVWAGTTKILSFEIKKATFGGNLNTAPIRAIIGDPLTGCDEKGFSVNVRNAMVFVIRGGCSFEEKARRIQQIGGKGAIVVNTRGKITAMTPGEGGAKDVSIPVVMIEKGAVEKLKSLLADAPKGSEGLLSRMVIKD